MQSNLLPAGRCLSKAKAVTFGSGRIGDFFRHTLGFSLMTFALFTADLPPAAAQDAMPAAQVLDEADLAAWLDGFLPYALASGDIAGAQVVVVKDGAVLLARGYGFADVAARVPMDPDRTMMRIGSTSKLFTWTAVMQLVEQGKIDLDADIGQYLDFTLNNPSGAPITMRDLMNHQGGFEEGLKDVLSTETDNLISTEDYLKNHIRPQLFAPGTVPAYSNYGAALAGYIVARVSGQSYEAYIQDHILLPLQMANTSFYQPLPPEFADMVAKGYTTASSEPGAYEQVITRPAGSGTATGADMARFMLAMLAEGQLDGEQILAPATVRQMQSPSRDALTGFDTMAHGFFYQQRNGQTMLGHGGDTVLFHSDLELLPLQNVGIYMSFNSRGTGDAVYALRAMLLDGFMDRYFPAPPTAPAATLANAVEDAATIAGTYQSSRRVEHGFISLFYMLAPTTITANADGTISAPDQVTGGEVILSEIAPQHWREVGGNRELVLEIQNGVATVIDSTDATSLLQAMPSPLAATLNPLILIASVAGLALTVILWPVSGLLRRVDRASSALESQVTGLRLRLRLAALIGLVFVASWYAMLQPVLTSQLDFYSAAVDPVLIALNVFGLVMIAVALAAAWWAYRLFHIGAPWPQRMGGVVTTFALAGILWISLQADLVSFTLNY